MNTRDSRLRGSRSRAAARTLDVTLLTAVIAAVEASARDQRISPSASEKAGVLAGVYEQALRDGALPARLHIDRCVWLG